MSVLFYAAVLQWKLDLRSRTFLVTCYIVPLLFFFLMGGIFTSVMPNMKSSLVPSMTVLCVSMGALIGMPPSLIETYGGSVKKIYRANGVPLSSGLVAMFLSAFLHLVTVSLVILLLSPVVFGAERPAEISEYIAALLLFTAASLGIGCVLGLAVKNQARQTMIAQIIFLPSIMLSGIMVPASLLPRFLRQLGKIFPATWGYRMMLDGGLRIENLVPILIVLGASVFACGLLLRKQ